MTNGTGSVWSRWTGSLCPIRDPGVLQGRGLPSGLEQQVTHERGNQGDMAYLQQVLGGVEASWATAHHTDLGVLLLCGEPPPEAFVGGSGEGMEGQINTPSPLPNPTSAADRSWSFPSVTPTCTLFLFFLKALAFAGSLTSSELPKAAFIQSPTPHP